VTWPSLDLGVGSGVRSQESGCLINTTVIVIIIVVIGISHTPTESVVDQATLRRGHPQSVQYVRACLLETRRRCITSVIHSQQDYALQRTRMTNVRLCLRLHLHLIFVLQ